MRRPHLPYRGVRTPLHPQDYWPLVAFARSPDGQVALLPSAGWLQQPSTPAAQAALVLDRKAVVEGDSLKVTGEGGGGGGQPQGHR